MSNYDAIIIGAGHNGLVTAGYLAKAGRKVLVLERRDIVGGAAVTEAIFPGFEVSSVADGSGYLSASVRRDLKIDSHVETIDSERENRHAWCEWKSPRGGFRGHGGSGRPHRCGRAIASSLD